MRNKIKKDCRLWKTLEEYVCAFDFFVRLFLGRRLDVHSSSLYPLWDRNFKKCIILSKRWINDRRATGVKKRTNVILISDLSTNKMLHSVHFLKLSWLTQRWRKPGHAANFTRFPLCIWSHSLMVLLWVWLGFLHLHILLWHPPDRSMTIFLRHFLQLQIMINLLGTQLV